MSPSSPQPLPPSGTLVMQAFISYPPSPSVLSSRYHLPSASPPLVALPLGAPLTSASTPASEDGGMRRRARRGRQQRRGHARAHKHPCLACSPDTRERRASQRCHDPPRHTTFHHPLPYHLEPTWQCALKPLT